MPVNVGTIEATLALRDEMTAKLTGALTESRKALDSFAGSATKVGGILTAALTVPIAAVGGTAIKMAMDAVESENLFEISFGGMAKAAREWSEQTSAALGLNQYELRKTSGMLFTMFDSMGIAKEGAFAMSTSLTKLSADMASFYNLKPEEAFQKLSAGITGEAEPLKRLGILVDENTTKMFAYKNGIAAMGTELSNQQKVLARYGSIMEQTAKAQGDLARSITNGSPAVALMIMRQKFEEISITLGNALMPALQGFIGILVTVTPYIKGLVDWFGGLPVPVRMAALAIAAMAAAIGPLVVAAGVLAGSFSAILGLLGPTAIGMATSGTAATGAAAGTTVFGNAMRFLYGTMLPIAAVIAAIWAAWKVGNIEGVKNTVAEWALRLQGFSKDAAHAAVQGHAQAVAASAQGAAAATASTATFDLDKAMKEATESAKKQASGMGDNEKANKAAAAAVAAHAKAVRDLQDDMSGKSAIDNVELLKEALKGSIPIWQMTYEQQQKVHATVVDAIAVYKSAAQVIPEDLLVIKAATENLAVSTQQSMSKMLESVKMYHTQMLLLNNVSPDVMQAAMTSVPASMKSAGVSGAGSLLKGMNDVLAAQLGPTILSALQGGGNVTKSIGGMLGGELGSHFMKGATSLLTGAFGKTVGGALGSVIPGLGTILGSQLGDFMMKGLSKVGSWFKGLFGGPSAAEKEGRSAAQAFRDELAAGLSKTQIGEAGGEEWKKSVIAIRDAYVAAGRSSEEALAMSDRLFQAEKQGGGAVQAVIDEITGVMNSATKDTAAGLDTVTDSVKGMNFSVTGSDEALAALGKTQETVTNLMLAGFDKLIAKLDQFVEKLGAATGLAQGLDVSTASAPGAGDSGGSEETPEGFAGGTHGAYPDFGSGTGVILHGRERVMTQGEDAGGGIHISIGTVNTPDAAAFVRDLPTWIRQNRNGLRTDIRAALGVA